MLLPLLLLGALAAPPDKVAVYVALPERDGFIDAGDALVESHRQLQHEIKVRKGLRPVAKREDADIVLTLVRREVEQSNAGGTLVMPIGPMLIAAPLDNSVVSLVVTLRAGDFERTVTGRFGWRSDAWQECAERVAKDVETWAITNRDRLVAQRARP